MHNFHLSSFKSFHSFSLPRPASFCISLLSYPHYPTPSPPLYSPKHIKPIPHILTVYQAKPAHGSKEEDVYILMTKTTRSLDIIQSSDPIRCPRLFQAGAPRLSRAYKHAYFHPKLCFSLPIPLAEAVAQSRL